MVLAFLAARSAAGSGALRDIVIDISSLDGFGPVYYS